MAELILIRRVTLPATLRTKTRIGDQVQTTESQIQATTTVLPDGTIRLSTDESESIVVDFPATELTEAWTLLTGTESTEPPAEQDQDDGE